MHNEAIKMAKWAMADALAKGYDNMNSQDWDDFKDCVETAKNAIKCDYYYRLVECMKKDEEEEKREDKYFLEMLKEENKDEYKRMREEYGEDEGERRFYDNYRYKRSGRFAPRGKGSYMPRRGYEEPPYYHMTPDMMRKHDPEYWRDMDRNMGKMYYTDGGNSRGQSGMSSNTGNSDGGARGYSEGYDDGQRRGYEEGMRDGRRNSESRYDRARRGYEEKKEMNKGNSPQENSENMKGLEELLNVVGGDVKELSPKMSPSEKAMTAQKFDTWSKMLKQ